MTVMETTGTKHSGIVVKRKWQRSLLTFFMVFGPGLIVMEADNGAGAVSTYMQAGGQYSLHLLWILVALLPLCYFVQEMVARLGIATGKGHAAMIHERFGKWWGRFSLIDLLAVNFLTLITEFAAISLALGARSQPVYLRSSVGTWSHADGCDRELSPLGTHRDCAMPDGSDLVCTRISGASELGRRRAQHRGSRPSTGQDHKQSRLPGHCDCRNHDCSVAALLPAELCRREEAAFLRSEMGTTGHTDRRDLYSLCGWSHDACW